ncbi:hypothetical protein [Thioalkalivibrio sp. ALJ2]|uniref:hypothetical protein n=1 Tax=Thioalkalivibrio sp. ALJ2 TaxID=1261622 RepID=UPI00039B4EB9|nr:hypothetical protein [Thioalkalivibrio sp. ALJ2]
MHNLRVVRSSEPYSDYGNLSGEGARRLLGTPATEPLLTAIRESVQNSWDAHLPNTRPTYLLRLRTLSPEEYRFLREVVFRDLSPDPGSPLRGLFRRNEIRVAEICDFGTHGLTGKTRPSEVTEEEDSRFVRFLRNIGAPRREGSHSGGTYGYGKSSLFSLGSCQTVVVDSLTQEEDGTSERRFMASRMGEEFYDPETGRSFTGRHWWGAGAPAGGAVDPVRNEEATRLADGLGMPDRKGRSGTSVMILDPTLEVEWDDHEGLAEHVQKAFLWFFWPKMVPWPGQPLSPMEFALEVEGQPCEIPSVESTPPFHLYAEALQQVRSAPNGDTREVRSRRPKAHLGWMGYQRGLHEERTFDSDRDVGISIPDVSRHVALMRPAELVVKYLEGTPLPNNRLEWAGVFVCSNDEEIEQAFAASEPPTHDDWNPRSLPKSPKRTYVNVALTRIKELMDELNPERRDPSGGASEGLAPAADMLGGALLSGDGDRALPRHRPKGGHNKPRALKLSGLKLEKLAAEGQKTVATFRFQVVGRAGTSVVLSADPAIVTEGSGELLGIAPDGDKPEIRGWNLSGENHSPSESLEVCLPEDSTEGELRVTVPVGVAVRPRLAVREAADE